MVSSATTSLFDLCHRLGQRTLRRAHHRRRFGIFTSDAGPWHEYRTMADMGCGHASGTGSRRKFRPSKCATHAAHMVLAPARISG